MISLIIGQKESDLINLHTNLPSSHIKNGANLTKFCVMNTHFSSNFLKFYYNRSLEFRFGYLKIRAL